MLSGLENPWFGNTVTNSCTNATYQNKPILFGVPARDIRIWLYLYLLHSWYKSYIYAPLTPWHLLWFRLSFASRCTNFQLLTHHLSYHQEFSCEALFMSVSYIWPLQTKPSSESQLQFLREFELLGCFFQHQCSKDNRLVTAHTSNFKTEATCGWFQPHTWNLPFRIVSMPWHPWFEPFPGKSKVGTPMASTRMVFQRQSFRHGPWPWIFPCMSQNGDLMLPYHGFATEFQLENKSFDVP